MACIPSVSSVILVLFSIIFLTRSEILSSSAVISKEYDFVIVGGGTAGNVVANRLTEDPNIKVLVIEAGGSNEGVLNSQVPFLWTTLFGSPYDWNSTTTPQHGLGGRSVEFARGYILGGSSSINGMIYTRGSAEDWNKIARITGDDGWSWNHIQPYIQKHERWSRPADNHSTTGQFDPQVHGFHGMTSVSLPGFPRPIDERVIQTTRENKEFMFNLDMNSGNPLGIGWVQSTITSGGRRDSSATSYFGPQFINRSNLHILLNNQVTRLRSANRKNPTAFNIVEFVQRINGVLVPEGAVTARREIILAAGSIGTPHILLHSGIGDRNVLSALGITPTHHLPDVGRNFTDQAAMNNMWLVNSTDTFETVYRNATLMAEHLNQWKRNGTGYFAAGLVNHLGFSRLPENSSIFHRVTDPSSGPNTPHFELVIDNGVAAALPSGQFISVVTAIVTPSSRGSITLNSSNPLDHPLVDPAMMMHEFDRFAMREAVRSAQRLLDSPAWNGYIIEPSGGLASLDIQNDDQLDEYVRANVGPGLHPTGSAAMSPKGAPWGVTDPDLRVKGVNGVRVVDASTIPSIPSGHTQAPVYIIAERAADIIKRAWAV